MESFVWVFRDRIMCGGSGNMLSVLMLILLLLQWHGICNTGSKGDGLRLCNQAASLACICMAGLSRKQPQSTFSSLIFFNRVFHIFLVKGPILAGRLNCSFRLAPPQVPSRRDWSFISRFLNRP